MTWGILIARLMGPGLRPVSHRNSTNKPELHGDSTHGLSFISAAIYALLRPTWLALALSLCWLPALAAVEGRVNNMNAVTARVFCLPASGDPQTGSGIIINGGALLVTNWHVVACTQEGGYASVLLNADTREQVTAVVQERYETQDLAILKLERRLDRPEASFATLVTLHQGDPVRVVGFPTDADAMGATTSLSTATLTEGVVGRLLLATSPGEVPLVQVSAAINPGNSGGPLFDEAGRVVGIVTLKSLATVAALNAEGGFAMQRVVQGEGLGWAVAVDALLPLLDRAGIPYHVSQRRITALERWWYREPVLVGALGLLGLLLLAVIYQLTTQTGRARVQAGFTRAMGQRRSLPDTPPTPSSPAQTPVHPPVQPPVRQPILRVVAGPYAGQTLPLATRPIAIGRNPALVQLVMPATASAISQRHAVVGHDAAQGFYVEDCWSTNGVFLASSTGPAPAEATRIPAGQPQPLPPGARFYLASPTISFEVDYQ